MRCLRFLVLMDLVICLILCGCSSAEREGATTAPRATAADASSRRLPGAIDEVRPVAERVFRSHFRFDPDASTDTRLVSRATEVEGRGEAHNVRDRIRLVPARRRQTAELHLQPASGAVVVQITVRAQRLETSERASFARQMGDDRPNPTAIDRSGPASVDTREEWVNAGRDTKAEREVLDEIQSSLAAAASQPER